MAPPPKPVRLRDRLARTSEALVGRLDAILGGRKVDSGLLDELEALVKTSLGIGEAPAPAPAQKSAEQRLAELHKLAAGGYITPEEYKSKKQKIIDGL